MRDIRAKEKPINQVIAIMTVILTGVQLLAAAGLEWSVIRTGVLPVHYQVVYLTGVLFLAALILLFRRNRMVAVILMVLSAIVTILSVYGICVIGKIDATLNQVKNESETEVVQMSLYVLKDSPIENLSDIDEIQVGYLSGDTASDKFLTDIKKNNAVINADAYDSMLVLADALLDGTEQAIIVNSAYVDMITEQDGYEDFSSQIRSVSEYEAEIESQKTETAEEKEPVELDKETFIVYLSGIDMWGAVNARSRSDVNILAVVNTATGHIQLINTPRDYYVYLPNQGANDKLTHAGLYGIDSSKAAIENLYGIQIDYYVRMNFSGFESIINTLGGIDVYSEYDFTVDPIKHYTRGYNHLNGLEALAFARERHAFPTGDIQRGLNQMEVIKAVINKMTSPAILANYSEVLDEVTDCIMMDIPSERIYSLVRYELATKTSWTVDSYSVTGTGTHSITYSMPGTTCYVMIPNDSDVEQAKKLIGQTLDGDTE